MKDDKKKDKKSTSETTSCCYHVVDACGCIVGWYCCEKPEMTKCRFESGC